MQIRRTTWGAARVRKKETKRKKREREKEKYQLSRWKSTLLRRGEVGTRDATDQDMEHNSRVSLEWLGEGRVRKSEEGGGVAQEEGEGARKVKYDLRAVTSGRPARRRVGSVRRLPRYATRARDVTGLVTRAPCAPDHVSCHALVAPSLPLWSLCLPLLTAATSPAVILDSPFSNLDAAIPFDRVYMHIRTRSLSRELITFHMHISLPFLLFFTIISRWHFAIVSWLRTSDFIFCNYFSTSEVYLIKLKQIDVDRKMTAFKINYIF